MDLRSRSRSKTPLSAMESQIMAAVENNHSYTSISASAANSRVLRSTKMRYVAEEAEETVTKVTTRSNHRSSNVRKHYTNLTSDYSSEDGEHDLSYVENNGNHDLESKENYQKQSSDEFIALKMYRDAKEYWNLYPKTDYTYSPHSKDRVELAPGVVNMPNMSRKPIHGVDVQHKETNTERSVRRTLFSSRARNGGDVRAYYRERAYVQISLVRRVMYAVFFVLYMATRPLMAAHDVIVRAVSRAHRVACSVMMVDTWLLRGTSPSSPPLPLEDAARQRSKLVSVLALCLLPLLLFLGIWLLSALGHAVALAIAATSEKYASPVETVAPIATEIKKSNLDVDVEAIRRMLQKDANVQPADAADIAAALTNEQIASIANHLHHIQIDGAHVDRIVEKVLESASIQNLIASYNANDHADQITQQEQLIRELHAQVEKLRVELAAAVTSNSAHYVQLSYAIKRCCRLNAVQMERYVNGLIAAVLNSKEHKDNMAQWLGALFVAQSELEARLHNATEKLHQRFDGLIKESAQRVMEDVSLQLAGRVANVQPQFGATPPDELQIRAIVKRALATYDADKTGLVDYALESAGGQILSTRCTEHYSARTSVVSIFGVPLWYPSASPRTVITPGVVPGECWAFQSFPGFVIIKLSHNVTIDAFSYEHVSRHLIPTGRVDSAPKDFQVFGLETEFDKEPLLLGEFQYDALGDALQFFPVSDSAVLTRSFQVIELKVNSNHGNPNYTCLYRFRVHGKIAT